jgi:hypothetical protein
MTSDRKIAANRHNAARSTGPHSLAGKARSSRNALRHGLAASLAHISAGSEEVERLAQAIMGKGSDPALLYSARTAAEAEFEILRIRTARVALINHMAGDRMIYEPHAKGVKQELFPLARGHPNPKPAAMSGENTRFLRPPVPEAPERTTIAFAQSVSQLAAHDRYERRAMSRRKRALQAIDMASRTARFQ